MKKMDQELKELLLSMQGEIKALRDDMNARFDKSDERMTKIEITQEQVTNKNISLLLEGQQGINDKFAKLDQVAEDVEEIKAKVTALEAVTKDNTSQIRELKIAK